jgi:hypothetical protein
VYLEAGAEVGARQCYTALEMALTMALAEDCAHKEDKPVLPTSARVVRATAEAEVVEDGYFVEAALVMVLILLLPALH